MSSVQPEAPPQLLLRSVEAFNRALRESSLGVSREIGCSKGTFAIVRKWPTAPLTRVSFVLA